MQPVIVGIDPGTTSAFAILSFDFKVLAVKSRKDYSLAGIIQEIYKFGNPILVGTDKKETPSFIKEFSKKTGSKIYSPRYDTKKGEKLFIVKQKGFIDLVNNAHETDAMACAIYAYNEYSQLIKKVESFVEKNNKLELKDKLLIKVITEDKSISDAFVELERKPVKKNIETKEFPIFEKKELSKHEKEILLLKDANNKLKENMKALEDENDNLKGKRIDINKQTKKTLSFKENRALELERQNRQLKKEIEKKSSIIKKLDGFIASSSNCVLLKRLNNLGAEEYSAKKDILKLSKGDILLVEDIEIMSNNTLREIKDKVSIIVYAKGNYKSLPGFMLLERKNFNLLETKYFCLAEKDIFENELKKINKISKKDSEYLKNMIDEYKRERELDKP